MKNENKTVYVITEPEGYVGVFTNMKFMFEELEKRNNTGTCDSETIWEEFPTYSQCLARSKKQFKNGYLFSLSLYPFDSFAGSVAIIETYLNKKEIN